MTAATPASAEGRRFLWWVALTTTVLAAGLAVLRGVFLQQSRSAEESAQLQADSRTALAFQREREFLRLRSALTQARRGRSPPDWDAVVLRHEIYASRVALLAENPSIEPLRPLPAYQQLMPRLHQLVQTLDAALPATDGPRLDEALQQKDALGREVQALTLTADRLVSERIAAKLHEVRRLRRYVIWLIAAQDLLADSALTPAQRDLLQTARASAGHLLALLNDILDLSALDAGQLRIQPEPVDRPEQVCHVQRWLQSQAERRGSSWACRSTTVAPRGCSPMRHACGQSCPTYWATPSNPPTVAGSISRCARNRYPVANHGCAGGPCCATRVSAWTRRPCRGCFNGFRRRTPRSRAAAAAVGSGWTSRARWHA